jgi:hypothetical protein
MTDVTLHIDEETTHEDREKFRDYLLTLGGVMAAAYHDEKPHLMLIEYDSDKITSMKFVEAARKHGLRAELIGL